MKEKIRTVIFKAANILELAISSIIIMVILILTFKLLYEVEGMLGISSIDDMLSAVLSTSFNMVIGIELVKMMVKHSAVSVIEVLAYSVARQMVVEHFGAADILIAVAALLLLFLIRKYLLTEIDILENTT